MEKRKSAECRKKQKKECLGAELDGD